MLPPPVVEPTLAKAAEATPPAHLLTAKVAFDQRFDGGRALLFTAPAPGGRVLIQTRRGSLVQDRFPDLVAAAVEQFPPGLDGDRPRHGQTTRPAGVPNARRPRRVRTRGSPRRCSAPSPANSRFTPPICVSAPVRAMKCGTRVRHGTGRRTPSSGLAGVRAAPAAPSMTVTRQCRERDASCPQVPVPSVSASTSTSRSPVRSAACQRAARRRWLPAR